MSSAFSRARVRTAAILAAAVGVAALLAQVGVSAFGAAAAPAAPRISSAPLRPTISTRATVAFDRVPSLDYECALDTGAYRSCASPVTYRGLSRSTHTFRVRASRSGGASSRPSTYSWSVVARRLLSSVGVRAAGDDDRPCAAVALEECDVRLALGARDDGGVSARRRALGALREPEDVPRPRPRRARLPRPRTDGEREPKQRQSLHVDDQRDTAASSADDHVGPRRLDDVGGRHVPVLRLRRRRSRVQARRRAVASVLEPCRLRGTVRRHATCSASAPLLRTGRSAKRRVAPGRSRRARPRSRPGRSRCPGAFRVSSCPEAAGRCR